MIDEPISLGNALSGWMVRGVLRHVVPPEDELSTDVGLRFDLEMWAGSKNPFPRFIVQVNDKFIVVPVSGNVRKY